MNKKTLADFIAPFPDDTPVIVRGSKNLNKLGGSNLEMQYLPKSDDNEAFIIIKITPTE